MGRVTEDRFSAIRDSEYPKYVACSVILQGLCEVPFECVMFYHEHVQKDVKLPTRKI